MAIVAIVPKEDATTPAKSKAFLRIILAVLVRMRSIYEKEGRMPSFPKIPARRVSEVLFNSILACEPFELSANLSAPDEVPVVFEKVVPCIGVGTKGWG